MRTLLRLRIIFLTLVMATACAWSQQPVVSRTPAVNAVDVDVSSSVQITLTDSYNLSTVNANTFKVWGSQSGFHTGSYLLINGGATLYFNPSADFTPGEVVSVTVTTGVEQTNTLHLAYPISWTFSVATSDSGVNYGTYSYYGTGLNAAGIVMSDVNKDGKVDVITANQNASNISVLLNSSGNTLAAHTTYSMGNGAYSLVAADVNSDGYPDIVTANYNANTMSVRLNNGDGTFGAVTNYNTGYVPRGIAAADIDGDGDVDMIVVNSDTQDLSVLKNNGDGTFAAEVRTPVGHLPAGVAAADLNADGYIDIAVTTLAADSVVVMFNNGSGTFSSVVRYATGDAPWGVALADVDGDHDADMVVTNSSSNTVSVRLNNGFGTFGTATDYSTGNNPRGLDIGDVDGDGDLDIAVAAYGIDAVSLLKNNGSGTFSAAVNYSTAGGTHDVAFGDLSGDGDVDIVAATYTSSTVSVIPNLYGPRVVSMTPLKNTISSTVTSNVDVVFDEAMNSSTLNSTNVKVSGSFRGGYSGSISYNGGSHTLTFNPDSSFLAGEVITVLLKSGIQDASSMGITFPLSYSFTVSSNTGYGTFAPAASYTAMGGSGGAYASVAADLNKDGRIDIATVTQVQNTLSIFMNNGNGILAAKVDYTTGGFPRDVVAADIDNDGDMDLLTAYNSSASLSVFKNNGNGTFAARTDYNSGTNASGLVAVDLDNDGDIDVVLTDTGNDRLIINLNNGSGVFGSPIYIATGDAPTKIAAGDFNADGFMDIVVVNSPTDNASVHYNDKHGALLSAVSHFTGDGPNDIVVATVNSTGKADFLTSNGNANTVSEWISNSGMPLGTTNSFAMGDYPWAIAATNIDADNDLDLIVANGNTSTLSFKTNNGSAVFSGTASYTLSSIANDVLAVDLNKDGRMDLVTSNENGTVSVILNSNGGHVASVSPVNGAVNVASSTNVSVTFDQPMSGATMTSSTVKLVGSISGLHTGALSYNNGTVTVTVDPTANFNPGEIVSVSVTVGVTDVNSVPLAAAFSSQFTIASGAAGGVFGINADKASGNQTQAVTVVDLNADGNADIATANFLDNTISVFLNNGSGTYASAVTYAAGNGPTSIAAGDVNGDGKVDLVVTSTSDNQISVFINNNNTGFNARTTVSISYGTDPQDIRLADIDRDGDLDAVYNISGYVYYMINNGSGSFSGGNNGTNVSAPSGLAVVDFDNDGDLDFLSVSNSGGAVLLSRYNGSNWYSSNGSYATGGNSTCIAAGDFNSDGYIDVVTGNLASGNGTISYLQNNQNSGLNTKVDYALGTGAQPRGIVAVDFDGDGDLDVVVTNGSADSIVVFTNNGSGVFSKTAQYATGDNPYAVASADIDGDGDMDIITANYTGDNISILKNSKRPAITSVSPAMNAVSVTATSNVTVTFDQSVNSGTLTAGTIKVAGSIRGQYAGAISYDNSTHTATFDPTNNFKAGERISVLIKSGIQNNDGAPLSTSSQWSFVAAATAEGAFGSKQNYNSLGTPGNVVTADMNGDGYPDVVSTIDLYDNVNGIDNNRISIQLNNGSGVLGVADTTLVGLYPSGALKVTDVNGDGYPDVIVTSKYGKNKFSVLLNDGTGNLAAPSEYTVVDDNLPAMAVGDLNGDGYNDIVVVLYGSNRVKTFRNNGNGTFTASDSMTTGTGPWDVTLTDIDKDGDLDIVTADYDGHTISTIKNNGNGAFAAKSSYSTGTVFPMSITAGDLNGDGNVDLVTADWWDNYIVSVFLQSTGSFSTHTDYSVMSPAQVVLGDMNGDGHLDIVVPVSDIGKAAVLTNTGSGSFSSAAYYSTGSYSQSADVADMDGDGDLDIVTANNGSGNISLLKNIELVAVSSIAPAANAVNAAISSNIVVTFNSAMNTATLVDTNVIVHGSMSGKVNGAISYDGPSKTMTFNPSADFMAGENITITLTNYIKSTNGVSLLRSSITSFTVRSAGAGNFVFADTVITYPVSYNRMNIINTGDITGDGIADLFGSYPGDIKFYQNSSATFDSISAVSINYTQSMPVADIDNDGDLDFIQSNYGNSDITPFINDGNGSFTAKTPFNTGINNSPHATLTDMDNDGRIDVMMNGGGSQQVYIFYDDARDQSYSGGSSYLTIHYDIKDYLAADVDNDGNNDIVTLHSGNGNNFVTISRNLGERSFAAPVDYTIAEGGEKITAADVNGDGYIDIIIANQSGKYFSVMMNAGNGTFGSPVDYNIGIKIYQIEAADIDGDGDIDLVLRGVGYNAVWDGDQDKLIIAYNNGSGNFNNQTDIDIQSGDPVYYSGYSDFKLLDQDNDGDLDIVVYARRYFGMDQYDNILIFKNIAGTLSAPTTAAANVTTSGNFGTSVKINWTNGNGSRRLVLVKQGSAVNAAPSDNGGYTSNTQYTSGSQIGTGNYAVFSGVGSSVTVSGLSLNTTYHVKVIEMNGGPGSEKFLTTSAPVANVTTNAIEGIPFDSIAGNAISFTGSSTVNLPVINLPHPRKLTLELWVRTGDNSINTAFITRHKNTSGGGMITPEIMNDNLLLKKQNNGQNVPAQKDVSGKEDSLREVQHASKARSAQHSPIGILPDEATSSAPIQIGIDNGMFFASVWDDDNSAPVTITGATAVQNNQWYHVALSVDVSNNSNNDMNFYVNGVQQGSTQSVPYYYDNQCNEYLLGTDGTTGFQGQIDEVRIWDTTRSAIQIRSMMHRALRGFASGVVGCWQFNEGSGTTSTDLKNGYDATLNSAAWTSSSVPIGAGTASTTAAFQTGSASIGNASLTMSDGFDNPVDVVVSEVSAAPNVWPTGYSASVGGKVFVIEVFGNPGTFSASLTLNFGTNVLDPNVDGTPGTLRLFHRSATSIGAWTDLGGATSASRATGDVTWTGITSFSQFMAGDQNNPLPIELISFSASLKASSVELKWATATEINNHGFDVERKVQGEKNEWLKIGFVEGNGNSNAPKEYSYIDGNVRHGRYLYRLKQIDRDGKFSYSHEVEVAVISAPSVFALSQNYPNPFNPSTTIEFTLQTSGLTSLKIYDAIGREVATLVNEVLEAGVYHQGTFDASRLASGVYFARLTSTGKVQIKKMVLMK